MAFKRVREGFLRKNVLFLFSLTTFAYAFSAIIHSPGNEYSDIVYIFNRQTASGHLLAPYTQSTFEYPVLTGLFFYLAAKVGLYFGQVNSLERYYIVTALAMYPFALGTVFETERLVRRLTQKPELPLIGFLVLAPTFWFYSVYNWYILGSYSMMLAINSYIDGKVPRSGMLFGISAATSLISAVPIVALLILPGKRRKLLLLGCALAAWGVINLPFIILSYHGWLEEFLFHVNVTMEDSWLVLIPALNSNLTSIYAKYLSLAVIAGSFFALYPVARAAAPKPASARQELSPDESRLASNPAGLKSFSASALAEYAGGFSWLSLSAFLLGSYIFAPQLVILLLPLFAAAFAGAGFVEYFVFLEFDMLNVSILLEWFEVSSPLQLPAVTQIFSVARCALLLGLVLLFLRNSGYGFRLQARPPPPHPKYRTNAGRMREIYLSGFAYQGSPSPPSARGQGDPRKQ